MLLTQDHNLISNTMEPRMKNAVHAGPPLKSSAVCLSERIRILFEHCSGCTQDPTEGTDWTGRVRFPSKMRQAV